VSTNLRDWMHRQSLTQSDVALIMGVTARMVRFWSSGQYPIPAAVDLLMRAVDDGLVSQAWLAGQVAKRDPGAAL
jgi:DNA-binding transcriptional regulator YiaG